MIELENHRQDSREEPAALVTPTAPPADNRTWEDAPKTNQSRNHRGNSGKRGNNSGNSKGGGKYQSKQQPTVAPQPWSPMPGWPPSWTPPPCPYPTYPGWTQPWPVPQQIPAFRPPRSSKSSAAPGFGYGQAHVATSDDGTQLNDVAQAFNALTMQPYSPFYMDTGASSHVRADAGLSEWESDSEEQ
ncbi:uncharacterized protein LOC141658528 [Silene latifolia]|uniref:uncharacterized protein LOC141658528 n=1 Tax=Silene latifolia TaxID=37657 RepID=UPI003D77A67B